MKTHYYGALLVAAALAVAPAAGAMAAEAAAAKPQGSIVRGEANTAAALLERAAAYLKKHGGKRAYAAFNERDGGFVSGPYYVYVVGLDGVMYANGGAPDVLAGADA